MFGPSFMIWGSLLGLIAITLLVIRLLLKRPSLQIHKYFFYLLIGAFVAGSALTIMAGMTATEYSRLHSFPQVQGMIDETSLVGERAFRPELKYHFIVDSTMYKGVSNLNPPMFGGKRKKYDVAHKLKEQFEVGDTVTVVYNPDNPTESYLDIRIPWHFYIRLSFGLILYALGFWAFLFTKSS